MEALDVAQVQVTQPKAPAAVVVLQAQKPVGNPCVLGLEFGLVAVATFAVSERLAGQPNAEATLGHHVLVHLAAARRPTYFFAKYTAAISALSFCSMYTFLFFEFLHSGHHRCAYAAELGAPLVIGGLAKAATAAKYPDGHACYSLRAGPAELLNGKSCSSYPQFSKKLRTNCHYLGAAGRGSGQYPKSYS